MSAQPDFDAANDPDILETQEWLDALEAVLEREGPERAHFLLEKMIERARHYGEAAGLPTRTSKSVRPVTPRSRSASARMRAGTRW